MRLLKSEKSAFAERCAAEGESPSAVHRRLIREYTHGGPAYFGDEIRDLRRSSDSLARVGNNLNQLARLAHQGEWPASPELASALESVLETVRSMQGALSSSVRRAAERRR